MSVHLVARNFYEGPSGRDVRRCEADTVLACFQQMWNPGPHPADDFAGSLRERIVEKGLPLPRTVEELVAHLRDSIYWPEIVFEEHAIQILTDDDEIELGYYFFDDHYRASHPADRTAFLLHDGWRLPSESAVHGFTPQVEAAPLLPAGGREGTTWFVLMMAEDTSCLTEMRAPMRIDGIRLPDLCRYLGEVEPAPGEPGGMDWPWELRLLRTQVPDAVRDAAALRTALERTNDLNVKRIQHWIYPRADGLEGNLASARSELAERLSRVAEQEKHHSMVYPSDPSRSLIQADTHVAQLCLNWVAPNKRYSPEEFYQWIFFDDLWAGGYPDLANGILRYVSRWDVLSEGEAARE